MTVLLRELRAVAGGAPWTLSEEGIAAALRVAAGWSPMSVTGVVARGNAHVGTLPI